MKTIYYGGPIITMENETDAPEAVLVDEVSGTIEAVGRLSDLMCLAGENSLKVDLKGKCLMPAFIDAHSHITMNGQMEMCANLSSCETFEDIIKTLQLFIGKRNVDQSQAVVGFGYDQNFLKEQRHPDKYLLDEVSKAIPIMILHISGHLACVNTAALRLANITQKTPDPQGGVIGRLKNGEPSGYLEEAGVGILQELIQSRIHIDQDIMLETLQKSYIENGITTVQDGATSEQSFALLKNIAAGGKLVIDVVAYPLMTDNGRAVMQKNEDMVCEYRNHLKIGGYKLILDGSPQGRSAWMSEPYLNGEPGYCGYPWLKEETVKSFVKQAIDEGQQILVHCNGDAASEQFINAYEWALKESNNRNKKSLRPVMIHCQTVRNDQLSRMAKLNMIASIFVGHVWYWGDIHIKNFGAERGYHISPVKDAIERGVIVNFHQDTPVTKPNMLHSVWCAVNRRSRSGKVIGTGQKISVYEALKAVTIHGAFQYFEENQKGSIKIGKRADLVILNQSPLDVAPETIKDIQVIKTIKDGKAIFQREGEILM